MLSTQFLKTYWIVLEVDFFFSPLNFHRQPGEDSKMLVCDACDKGYHTFCLQPAMDSLPSDPWKCRVSLWLSCPNFVCEPVHTHFETENSLKNVDLYQDNSKTFFPMSFTIAEVSCLCGMWCAGTGTSRFGPVV